MFVAVIAEDIETIVFIIVELKRFAVVGVGRIMLLGNYISMHRGRTYHTCIDVSAVLLVCLVLFFN